MLLSISLMLFPEPNETKLEVCINHIAVPDRGCTNNNSLCLHTSKVRCVAQTEHQVSKISALLQ